MAEHAGLAAAPRGTWLYAATRILIRLLWRLFTHGRLIGIENLPPEGGVLIVSNHLSIADPVILMGASPRPLVFMAKEEIFRSIAARAFFRLWGGTFAVRRGQNDVRAVRDALALIRAGAALVVFPEGTRRTTGLGEAQPGIGYLASRLGCPVVPVAIVGTERIGGLGSLRDHPSFTVTVGEPLHVSDRSMSAAEVAARIMSHVAALLPPARRGAYAVTSEPAVTA